MKAFEIISYNFNEQRFDIRVNHLVKKGYFVLKDIDLENTLYKMDLWDMKGAMDIFFIPIPKYTFDFQREDFGGFILELVDEDKQYNNELPPDDYLNKENKRIQEDKLLNSPSISGWRKNKILNSRNNDENEVKTY